jgi:phenylpropionate dioxygenase-like ring-hydroxylating dioxygenase large terminal subunit
MTLETLSRFPFGMPHGWFPVSHSEDLAAGELRRLSYFGRELVLFRGEGGSAHLLDAYCAHLGAHLAVGGAVVGDSLRCPFHAWRWNGEGKCIDIPYAKRIPAGARIEALPIEEHSGLIWAWHHPDGAEPNFRIPSLPEHGSPEWTSRWLRFDWKVKTHPQEVFENGVDFPHFSSMHGFEMPENIQVRFDGPEFHWGVSSQRESEVSGPTPEAVTQTTRVMGLGMSYLRYTGALDTLIAFGVTPIDEETSHLQLNVIGRKEGRSEETMTELLSPYAEDQAKNLEADFPIWEHKRYRAKPPLCEADGPLGAFRAWARQFYSEDLAHLA